MRRGGGEKRRGGGEGGGRRVEREEKEGGGGEGGERKGGEGREVNGRRSERNTHTHTYLLYELSILLSGGVPAVVENEDIWF